MLGKNSLGDHGALSVAAAVCKNLNVVHLDLSSNDLAPDGAKEVIRLLAGSQSIVSLDLSS